MDDQSVFLFSKNTNRFFTTFDEMSLESKKAMFNTFCCLFPRDFVDARPGLNLILRSVREATSAPYDIDTILCALLLEQHKLLEQFCDAKKCHIDQELIKTLLAKFDLNSDVNPLDDPEFYKTFLVLCDDVEKQDVACHASSVLVTAGTFKTPNSSVTASVPPEKDQLVVP